MRIMGKRQMGELEISELVVAVVIADMAAVPLQDIGIPMINGLIPVIILLCCEILITGIATKSIYARLLLFGRPSTLIENGIINQKEMKKNRFTIDELYEQLRQHSITDITKIERAILETSGILNIILFPEENTPTCKQLGIQCPSFITPIILIIVINDIKRLIGNRICVLNQYHFIGVSSLFKYILFPFPIQADSFLLKVPATPPVWLPLPSPLLLLCQIPQILASAQAFEASQLPAHLLN
jgi:uncharacterized membrane protein YcaP (DUF421 family)